MENGFKIQFTQEFISMAMNRFTTNNDTQNGSEMASSKHNHRKLY
jgi:hypothetical protein